MRIRFEDTLFLLPVSRQWRRGLLEHLDAVAVIYSLASAITQVFHPLVFRWYRAMPLDAAIALPGGWTLTVVRRGNTADHTVFAKRLWRLGQLPPASAVLMLLPDEVRLRQARRLAAALPGPVFLALESDAASAGAGAAVWRTPSGRWWRAPGRWVEPGLSAAATRQTTPSRRVATPEQ